MESTGNQTHHARLPSEVVTPSRSDTAPQQASTSPGDGTEVHPKHSHPHQHGLAVEGEKIPFKEQVIGYAQKTRGTLLGQPGLKEHGEMVLEGQASAKDAPSSIPKKETLEERTETST